MRCLESSPQRQMPVQLVHRGDTAAGLERARVDTLIDDAFLGHDGGLAQRPRRARGVADLPGEDVVVVSARPMRSARLVLEVISQDGRVRRHRLGRIDEHRQFLVLDLDQIDGVGRNVAILGHDERDLLALEQHFVIGQYGLNIAGQCRHPMQLERLQVVGGEHRLDTGQLERRVFLDRFDPGVTVGRPDEITEQHARQLEIAPSATMTADMSLPGSPFATLPPRVPQYRTCGSAICNEVSANDRARRREQLRSDQFVLGGQRPMTTASGSLRIPRNSSKSCRSTRCSGLANRSFIIGIRLWSAGHDPSVLTVLRQQPDGLVQRAGPMVLEWRGYHFAFLP
jgi:hypothetical protein